MLRKLFSLCAELLVASSLRVRSGQHRADKHADILLAVSPALGRFGSPTPDRKEKVLLQSTPTELQREFRLYACAACLSFRRNPHHCRGHCYLNNPGWNPVGPLICISHPGPAAVGTTWKLPVKRGNQFVSDIMLYFIAFPQYTQLFCSSVLIPL